MVGLTDRAAILFLRRGTRPEGARVDTRRGEEVFRQGEQHGEQRKSVEHEEEECGPTSCRTARLARFGRPVGATALLSNKMKLI